MKTLSDNGLRIEISRSSFLRGNASFLGHTLDKDGLRMCNDKVKAIIDFSTDTNADSFRS